MGAQSASKIVSVAVGRLAVLFRFLVSMHYPQRTFWLQMQTRREVLQSFSSSTSFQMKDLHFALDMRVRERTESG